MKKRLRPVLEKIYLLLICVLFLLIVMTPYVITESLSVGENLLITQQVVQSAVICFMLIFGYVISLLYRREINRQKKEVETLKNNTITLEERLEDAFKYIGTVNVQMQQIRSAFEGLKEYKDSHTDFQSIMIFVSKKILGLIQSDWVLIRVLKPDSMQTLGECVETRGDIARPTKEISNKDLINFGKINSSTVVQSKEKNLKLRIFCVFDEQVITNDQRLMIESLLNDLEVLFVLFTSEFYKR